MASAPQIAIQISGRSDLDKVLGQTNKQIALFSKQSQKTASQISKISETGRRGFALVDKNITSLVRNTWQLFQNVSRIVDPLGIIAGGATLAGLTALEVKFSQLGLSQVNVARGLSMSITNLSKWQGAAKIAGFEAQTATDGIRSTEIAMAGAKLGQNNAASTYLNQLVGPQWKKMNEQELLMAEAKKLHSLHGNALALAESNAGDALGQSSEFISFLAQGPAALQKQLDQAQKNGSMTGGQADVLATLGQSVNSLEGALEGLGTSLTSTLAPDFTKMTDAATKWLDANRDLLTKGISNAITAIGGELKKINWTQIGSDIKAVFDYLTHVDYQKIFKGLQDDFDKINSVVQSIGGWKVALIAVLGILTASKVASIALPFVALSKAIGLLSGGGLGSFAMLGAALRGIGFGVVAGQIVKMGAEALGAGAGTSTVLGDATTGAVMGGAVFGLPGAAVGGALGAAFGGYQVHKANMEQRNERGDAMMKYYESQGLTPVQAAGLVGNFQQESSLDPHAQNGSGHYGIAQWDAARQADFAKIFGHPIQKSTLQEQMQFSLDELFNGKEGAAGRQLLASKTGLDATLAGMAYERPATPGTPAWQTELGYRLPYASTALARNAPQYLPSIDDAGNAGPWPQDSEGNHLLGQAAPGSGMGSENRSHVGLSKDPNSDNSYFGKRHTTTVAPDGGLSYMPAVQDDKHVVVEVKIQHDGKKMIAKTSKASPGVTAKIKTATAFGGDTGWIPN